MSRSNAAFARQPEANRPPRTRRFRVTVGDLVAASYEVLGEHASPEDVARLVRAVAKEGVEAG
jgi:hypothetical protein